MHIFLDKFHQGRKYSTQRASQQTYLRRDDQKYLSISSLQTDYLNIESSSGCGKYSEIANIAHKKCNFCGGANHSAEFFQKDQKGEGKILCSW